MLKCSRKRKIGLLMAVVYAALTAVLLTEISYAKYQEERVAYANFGAASFNSVILSADNTKDAMANGTVKVFDIFDEALKLDITEYRPGMKYDTVSVNDTSKKIGFVIANGEDIETASEANVQYQIRLRTTGHLPLKYSLLHKKTGENVLYKAGEEKTKIQPQTEIGTTWYEQCFVETVSGGGEREVSFDMPGGTLALNEYELVVEWPDTMADARYMKEVELLQLFVTVSSKNMLEEDGYGDGVAIEVQYGNGVVILDPNKGDKFVHYVDYRAFRKEADESIYTLTIENGVDKQVTQTKENTNYMVEIEVPWVAATEKTTATTTFKYYLQPDGGEPQELTSSEYRLYSERYSSLGYNICETIENPTSDQIAAWSEVDSEQRLYKVFWINGETMNNKEHNAQVYHLILSGDGSNSISEKTAFEHKIKVLVRTTYTGNAIAPAVPAEGGDADG